MSRSLFLLLTLRPSRGWWSLNIISMWAIPFRLPMIGSEIQPVRWKVFTGSLRESSSLFPRASSKDSLSLLLRILSLTDATLVYSAINLRTEEGRANRVQGEQSWTHSMVSLRLLYLWIFNYEMISLLF